MNVTLEGLDGIVARPVPLRYRVARQPVVAVGLPERTVDYVDFSDVAAMVEERLGNWHPGAELDAWDGDEFIQ